MTDEIRWSAGEHYDAAMQALAAQEIQLAIAHALLGLLRTFEPR